MLPCSISCEGPGDRLVTMAEVLSSRKPSPIQKLEINKHDETGTTEDSYVQEFLGALQKNCLLERLDWYESLQIFLAFLNCFSQ